MRMELAITKVTGESTISGLIYGKSSLSEYNLIICQIFSTFRFYFSKFFTIFVYIFEQPSFGKNIHVFNFVFKYTIIILVLIFTAYITTIFSISE